MTSQGLLAGTLTSPLIAWAQQPLGKRSITSSTLCLACFQNQCFMDDTAKFSGQLGMGPGSLEPQFQQLFYAEAEGMGYFLRQSFTGTEMYFDSLTFCSFK